MHEYSIVAALVERVEAEVAALGALSVRRLRVEIGQAAGVEVELLRSAYEVFRAGTPCAAAELDIDSVPVLWGCATCDEPAAPGDALMRLRCPRCAGPLCMLHGDELTLRQIEMEV